MKKASFGRKKTLPTINKNARWTLARRGTGLLAIAAYVPVGFVPILLFDFTMLLVAR